MRTDSPRSTSLYEAHRAAWRLVNPCTWSAIKLLAFGHNVAENRVMRGRSSGLKIRPSGFAIAGGIGEVDGLISVLAILLFMPQGMPGGAVGSVVVQVAREREATVIGTARAESSKEHAISK